MKRLIIAVLLLTFSFSLLISANLQFDAQKHHQNKILVCFNMEAVGNKEGIINFTKQENYVKTGIQDFDILAKEFQIKDMQQVTPDVVDRDWNKNGLYPRLVYRLTLTDNRQIESAIAKLDQIESIRYAEFDQINRLTYIPNDPLFGSQWHHQNIMSEFAWDYSFGSNDVIVGIVDTGIKWNHPDLRDNIWVNQPELDAGMTINWENGTVSGGNGVDEDGNGKVDDVIGWDFYSNTNQSYQFYVANDHGTHVAGCVGAVGDNTLGVAGASMNVKLISSRHAPTSSNSSYISAGLSGIYYCVDSGADFINCSFGGGGSGNSYELAADYAIDHNSLIIAAAGNDNTNNAFTPQYPSDATNAVSVAATGPGDIRANFSNYGPPIDVAAPGVDIKSTIIAGNSYASYQGTSMASPIVAGVAALAKSLHPELSGAEMRQRLMDTCDYIDDINPGFEGMLGSGRVNSFQALMYDLIPNLTVEDYNLTELNGDGDSVPNPGEELELTIMLQNGYFTGGAWREADDVTATLNCDVPGVTIESGSETAEFGYIGQYGAVWNDSDPFIISTESSLSDLVIPFTLTISANPDDPNWPYETTREFDIELSLLHHGWPFVLGGSSSSSAVIINVDGEGDKEVVFADQLGNIHAVAPNGVDELPGFPVESGSSNISAALAAADLDDNGKMEIVAGTEGNEVLAIDYQGNILFQNDIGGQVRGNPMISDLDGNGTKEIVTFTLTGNIVSVLNADGSDYPGFPTTLSSATLASPALADLNGDGYKELITATVTGQIFALSVTDATNIEGWPVSIGMGSWNGPSVADIDGDTHPEVLVGTLQGKILILNHDGTTAIEKQVGGQVKTGIVCADVNNDESLEIAFANTNGEVYLLDSAGNELEGFPVDIGAATESTPVMADMDNNGTIDIILGDNSGYLHSIDMTGSETPGFPLYYDSALKTSPALGDVDNDGDLDIAVANLTSYLLVDYKNPTGEVRWPNFKYDAARTGNMGGAVGTNPVVTPNLTTNLGDNYPNPFNPVTNIYFSLKQSGNVQLEIFNLKGQLVKTLINSEMSKGGHTVTWQGKDKNDAQVASGIYLYRLTTDDYSASKKMLMLK
ncbi:MAG: serine protease [Candidatus Cloacimonadota bacterium]|jgi:subtilisin family serine protease|nr:serine protease [Candidatus Cloacimonadota bacterium]